MNAWDLGTISGIRIRIHWTFFLLPIYIYFSSLLAGSGIAAATISILFVLAIFGCVLLHELGHALAARQFGIGTRDITLLPIGGVAALQRMPRNPWQELWIAVAGPLVNVVIAAMLFVGLLFSQLASVATTGLVGHFLTQLMFANIVLVVFNMIPAFPMDGGRVLRSVLAMFKDYGAATNIAATVGKIVAIAFAFFALTSGNLMLLLVAAFVYFAAHSENLQVAREQHQSSNPRRNSYGSSADHGNRGESFVQGSGFHDAGEGDGIWYADEDASSPNTSFPNTSFPNTSFPNTSFPNTSFPNASSPNASSPNAVSVPATLAIHAVAAWLRNQSATFCSVMDSGKELGQISRATVMNACARGMGNLPIGRLL